MTAKTLEMTPMQFVTKFENFLHDLHDRWQDERAHEDFDDYRSAIRKILPEGWTLTKATSRPFEFEASTPAQKVRVRVLQASIRHWATKPKNNVA